uniref:Retrotransposon gag domain-containing protein n=1 Tax=Nymphaea colorata TaxID=210225 RepID=A0A5K1EZ24_9MAGN|nr:unnamed protein product [Nymphaea colorata]
MKASHAAMNFEGPAIRWFRWLVSQRGQPDWQQLVATMTARFGSSIYVDYNAELSKYAKKEVWWNTKSSLKKLATWFEHGQLRLSSGNLSAALRRNCGLKYKRYDPPLYMLALPRHVWLKKSTIVS